MTSGRSKADCYYSRIKKDLLAFNVHIRRKVGDFTLRP